MPHLNYQSPPPLTSKRPRLHLWLLAALALAVLLWWALFILALFLTGTPTPP